MKKFLAEALLTAFVAWAAIEGMALIFPEIPKGHLSSVFMVGAVVGMLALFVTLNRKGA